MWLHTMGGKESSSSNTGINPVFDNKAVRQRGGSAPHCVSLSTSPRCVSSVSRVSCMVIDCLCCTFISAQRDLTSSSRFMICCGCGGDGDMFRESGEQGAVCAKSESLLSMVKHIILRRIITALSSTLLG
jgi:hypothetical protein